MIVTTTIRPFNNFPRELLLIILSYYTTDFRKLVTFSSLSSACKDACDHSEIWLKCNLSFFAPKRMFISFKIIPSSFLGSVEEYLSSTNMLEGIPEQTHDLSSNTNTFIFVYLVHFKNSMTDRQHDSHQQQPISPEVMKNGFLKCFIEYQKNWIWQAKYGVYLHQFHHWFESLKEEIGKLLFVPIILFSISAYCFSDLSESNTFTTIGFSLILMNILYSCFFMIGFTIYHIIHRWFYHFLTLKMPYQFRSVCELFSAIMISLGLLLPFILAWLKFSNESYLRIPWYLLPLLMWSCFIAAGIIWVKEIRKIQRSDFPIVMPVLYLMNTIPLSLFLTGLYFENGNHSGMIDQLSLVLIPLYPFFLFIFGVTIYRIIALCYLGKRLFWDISLLEAYQQGRLGRKTIHFSAFFLGNACMIMCSWSILGLILLSFGMKENQYLSWNAVVWVILIFIGLLGFLCCLIFADTYRIAAR